jgi:predicted hydrocarbon binding protein
VLRAARPDEPATAHFGLVVKAIPMPLNTALRGIEPMQIVRAARPQAGRDTSLWMLRVAYFQGLLQTLEKDQVPWGLLAGRKFGRLMDIDSFERMQRAFQAMGIGIAEMRGTEDDIIVEVWDCMLCCGLMGIDEPCCSFIGGIIGAVASRVKDRDSTVRETRCMGQNHEVCRFEIEFSRSVSLADLTSQAP